MKIISRVVGAGLVPALFTPGGHAKEIAAGIVLGVVVWIAVVLMFGGWELVGGR